jgi:glutamate transport system substrate-binding protein
VKRRLNALVLACGVTASLVLAGCASSNELSQGSGAGSGSSGASAGSGDTLDKLVADAPVAGSIPDGTLMAKIKQAGVLKVGGTDAGPVFSIKDPVSGKLTGFDATLSQMLAKYIIGQPKTSLTLTSVATREPLLQNGTVDTVFATYTITPARA